MLRKIITFIFGLVLCLLAIAGPLFLIKTSQFKAMASAPMVMPTTTVTAAPAAQQKWENLISATGSFAPVQGVTVGAEVPGKIVKIGFEAGAVVKANDILVQLDISTEEAQLQAAQATAALAKANLDRAQELRKNNTNSPAELDAADAQAKQANAQADMLKAQIAKKTIRAPFAGRLGLRMVNLGQILKDGDPITTLQTLDPIYINFSLPQQRLSQISTGTKIRVTTDAAAGDKFEGTITALNAEVDQVTRNIRVQATVPNNGEKLRSGMFGTVEVVLPQQTDVIAIPVTAVSYATYGNSVFVVEEQKDEKSGKTQLVLRQQTVRLGEARGDFVNVLDGVKPGQQIVTSGVFKLRAGMPVIIDNKMAPKAEAAPKPGNA
jgi:membrane fusion protein (multidrug efflux system)